MAAGLSQRFGENKLLVEINGKSMYKHVLENVATFFKKYPDHGVGIVVSSYEDVLNYGENLNLCVVYNENANIGQSESIRLGLSVPLHSVYRDRDREAAVFLTADQPWMKSDTLERFFLEAMKTETGFLSASFNQMPGNPVSFDEQYYPELMNLRGDEGGKRVMKRHLDDVAYFEIDASELKDVDQPEDLT